MKQASAWGPTRWPRKCGLKIFYDAAHRRTREDSARGLKRGTRRRSYFHRLCPAAPRKYSGTKYVNERNTSCKSEGTSKAKASYLQLDIVQVGTKKQLGIGGPAGTGGRKGRESREALRAFNPPRWVTALENLRSRF